MLARGVKLGLRLFYKRNSRPLKLQTFYSFSTNQNKFKTMEEVKELEKKVEAVKVEGKQKNI